MSAQTLQAIEDAILAHHRETTDAAEKPERANAVITAWVVSYEISNLVDVGPADGGTVVGFHNEYITSDSSPNMHVSLADWAAGRIATDAFEDDDD
ncbi:hypothetical protein GRS96_12430 [Rathayibacter sp. VKM Ac-2803]|uniref:hypothetical protein n=1 Tax=Rathayibacter sp. VKM Ac-2803 TaxID=2609256 RepID=UPI001357B20C|nr:hypothetical protein [Rathayibacter sp. VKM Ac-2803]MWV50076.1 hypothetical protein [Rathayibacter sp. VKM Ac-2803]